MVKRIIPIYMHKIIIGEEKYETIIEDKLLFFEDERVKKTQVIDIVKDNKDFMSFQN